MAGIINLNNTTPAPPSGSTNVHWQGDSSTPRNVSAYLPNMVGDSGSGGSAGAVPGPAAGTAAAGKFLKADGTWAIPPVGGLAGASVKTGSYTVLAGDANTLLAMNSSSAQTITLPASPPSGTWCVFIQNIGAGVLTVNRNGLTIDTAASNLTVYTGEGVVVFTDGTNYFTERGKGFSLNMPAVSHQFLTAYNAASGQFSQAQPADADLSVTNVTTNNVSTAAHGFAPKSPGSAAVYLDGTGAYSTPSGLAGGVNAQTGSYTAVSGDSGKLITFSSPAVLTLPTTPPSSTWAVHIENASAGSVSIATAATAYPAGWTPRQAAGAGTTGGNAGECLDTAAATAATYSVTVTANTACYIQSVLCALKPSGSSAPAYVQGSVAEIPYQGHAYAVASYASANAAGNCLICDVWFQSNSALVGTVSVTDTNGNTWSLVAGSAGVTYMAGGVTAYSGTWVAPNCAGGANTVTVSNGGLLVEQTFIGLHEYSGVPTSSPIDVSHQTNSSTAVTTVSPSVTTTGTNRTLHLFGAMYGNYLTLGAQLDGANASLLLGVNQGAYIATDGSNYFSQRGVGSGSSYVAVTATTSSLGVVKPDGTTINVSSGVISAPTATSSVLGLVKPDGTSITNTAGVISVATATTSVAGLVKPDGSSITISGGVITAASAVTSLTTVGSAGAASLSAGVLNIPVYSGGGGGGSSISAGTFASLPGSPSAGQMYLFTNSIYDSALYQTSVWIYLKDGKQMTPPTGFAWMNQSTATLTTANGGENLLGAVGGAANNVNCRYVAYPTAPFTRTVAMRQSNMSTLGHQASNAIAGLFLSDGTKMEIFGLIGQGPSIGLQIGPTVNNINANVTGPTLTAVPSSNLIWYRVDDGVTASGKRTFFISFDGIQFIQVYQESNTQYLTPTRIGYFVSAYETGTYSAAWVLHWA